MAGRKIVRYKDAKEDDVKAADVLIINCYGLLSSIYHYGDVAYVGGGFGVGIHNLLEAAVWDVPVFFGPNNQKFQEAQGLKKNGGFEIHDYEEFERQMSRLASERSGRCYRQGAWQRYSSLIFNLSILVGLTTFCFFR